MASAVLRRARAPAGLLLGGEWAGWCCAFDATGAVKPVPEKHLSETAIAWGQVPCGFEELQTEAFERIPLMDGSDASQLASEPAPGTYAEEPLRRRRVITHPPYGCGGDSLPGDAVRCLLPIPCTSAKLSLVPSTASRSDAEEAHAWALDTPVDGRPGVWRLESILRGLGGTAARPTNNALPTLGERTRVAVLFDVRTGELAAEAPHPSTPHIRPRPEVLAWQERCWSRTVALQVSETSWGPLHMDAVDKSQRVGMHNFGEQRQQQQQQHLDETRGEIFIFQGPLGPRNPFLYSRE